MGNSSSECADSSHRGRSDMDRPAEMKEWDREYKKISELSEIHTVPDLQPQKETSDVKIKEVRKNREAKKKYEMFDAPRTPYEITLYEKSKEIALIFKDKANDEEILKKQFNLFWEKSVKKLMTEANDPAMCVEKKREEYYSIFQKYCHVAASSAIFGETICQKLKELIEQSVYKKTSRYLADEVRINCESLNGNRSNLEKHILKRLAEEEDFSKYMNYIHNPKDHFKSFIRNEVSRYITDRFSVRVLPEMKRNIELLEQKIMKAAHQSTKHVQENRGDAGLWLKRFTRELSDELVFSERDLSGVKHDDVEDFNLLEDVMRQQLCTIVSEIRSRFNTESFPEKLDYKHRPDNLLIDHICGCCWVQCPFCGATCTNSIENHEGNHYVPFHRIIGQNGWFHERTTDFSLRICTTAVACNNSFYPKGLGYSVPWRDYRRAGGVYAQWSICPDLSDLPYWKWFVCRFQKDLEKYYNKTFKGYGEIPDIWKQISKQDALRSFDTYM